MFIQHFVSTFASITIVLYESKQLGDVKRLIRKTELEFSPRVGMIANRRNIHFFSERKSFAFVLGLQLALQHIVAFKIGELNIKKKWLKNGINKSWMKGETYLARVAKLVGYWEMPYASMQHGKDEAHIMYGAMKWSLILWSSKTGSATTTSFCSRRWLLPELSLTSWPTTR